MPKENIEELNKTHLRNNHCGEREKNWEKMNTLKEQLLYH